MRPGFGSTPMVNQRSQDQHAPLFARLRPPSGLQLRQARGAKAMRPIFETLYEYGVDLFLAGHEHNYERFAPQDPQGALDLSRGIRQSVVGTGGREHRRIGRPKPNSEVRDRGAYGVLKLTFRPQSYDWGVHAGGRSHFPGRGDRGVPLYPRTVASSLQTPKLMLVW